MASPPHERFSLLLLEDNEVLLDDVAVDYEFLPATSAAPGAPLPSAAARLAARRGRARGRLKLASRSLAFDPDDLREPVVRVPLDAARPARLREADPPHAPPAPPLGAAVFEEPASEGNPVDIGAEDGIQNVAWTARLLGGFGLGFLAQPAPSVDSDRVTIGDSSFGTHAGSGGGLGTPRRPSSAKGSGSLTLNHSHDKSFAARARGSGLDGGGDNVVVGPHVETGRRVSMRMLQPLRREAENSAGSADGLVSAASSGDYIVSNISVERHLAIRASRVLLQREGGADHAYIDAELRGTHCFYPLYSSPESLLDLVSLLQRIAALPARREREQALRDTVRLREEKVPFDITWLEGGLDERTLFDRPCSAVSALSRAPGRARISTTNIYLMPIHGGTGGLMTRVPLSRLISVRPMKHGLRDSALEIGYDSSDASREDNVVANTDCEMTMMLAFKSRSVREEAIVLLSNGAPRRLRAFDQAELDRARSQWRAGRLSNFDYILFLNLAAGRSFNDLSQYPVFPWVLADYDSVELDLNNPATFRDLSLPIGALEPSRRAFFQERYQEMPPPQFHYGTHYSTPAYVINFLVRAVPGAMLRLQNGKFDAADRLFNSVADAWGSVANSTTDVKELIPEFYAVSASETPAGILPAATSPTDFLENVQCLDLGMRQDGKRVDDVELPPWANGSAGEFLAKHRLALESMHVSRHIHLWVDLIFGVKARSASDCNVFYTDVAVGDIASECLDEEEDGKRLDSFALVQTETILLEFGRTPAMLFQHPHPPRFGSLVTNAVGLAEEIVLSPRPLPRSSVVGKSPDAPHSENGSSESDNPGVRPVSPMEALVSGVNRTSPSAAVISSPRSDCPPMKHDDIPLPAPAVLRRSSSGFSSFDLLSGTAERAFSTASISERRLSITLSPSCSLLRRFTEAMNRGAAVAKMLRHKRTAREVIIDFAIAFGGVRESDDWLKPTVVTAWSDGYLRVFIDSRLHRSRHVTGLTSIACGEDARMFMGTVEGSLILYSISSGRSEVLMPKAHAGGIFVIRYLPDHRLLVTGSEDATVTVWHVDAHSHVLAMLHRVVELDAEDAVVSIAADVEESTLYVACMTALGRVLAWEVNTSGGRLRQEPPDPVLDLDVSAFQMDLPDGGVSDSLSADGDSGYNHVFCVNRLCWLELSRRARMLAVLYDGSNNSGQSCVRLWDLGDARMPAAKIVPPHSLSASCVSRGDSNGNRTVLVAGEGYVAEYDQTGLLLHELNVGDDVTGNVTGLCVAPNERQLFARSGSHHVLSWSATGVIDEPS